LKLVYRAMGALVLLALIFGLLVARFMLWPASDTPRHADAVVVLSGDHGDRLRMALHLLDEGVARTLVQVGSPDSPQASQLCSEQAAAFETVCLSPNPGSTRYQARAVADLMRDRGWNNVVVVTTTHHLTRARLLFERCSDRKMQFVGSKPAYDSSTSRTVVFHEMGGLVDALTVSRGC
jgi:uncharacterized SAM-binding protein YcdF (DUF218 family)